MSEPEPNRSGAWRFAALMAHQLRSPIAAAASLLRTVLGGFAGPLTDRQRDLLARADTRCDQALESVERMLAIGRAVEKPRRDGQVCDVVKAAREAAVRWQAEAFQHDIVLLTALDTDAVYVYVMEDALTEVFDALLSNAFKYTPDHGRIRLAVAPDASEGTVSVSVADSGIGVAEEDREKVFEPFMRAASAQRSSRPGTGLGLAFVKAVIEAGHGHVGVRKADLGGAEFVLDLPMAEAPQTREKGERSMPERFRVVIVGGVAAGPKVAAKIMRLRPDADVTVVERGKLLSYAGCGLPYYVSG
ncbi:MAG: hypothetical protein AMS14_00340, partial [Planctomycetes bacterium DG_20]